TGLLQWAIEKSLRRYAIFLDELIRTYKIDVIEMPDFQDYIQYCTRFTPFPKLPKPTIVKLHGSHTYFYKEAGNETPEHMRKTEEDLLRKAKLVTSVSNYTADRTATYLNYQKKIVVLYNGIETSKCE